VEQLFAGYGVKLFLCGDAHDPWRRVTNDVLEITMGCLVDGEKNVRPAFSIGELKGGKISVEAHEWDSCMSAWGLYSHFNNDLATWALSKRITKPAAAITLGRPTKPPYLFGRDGLIRDIEAKLESDNKVVLLNGMGGIGKTEICRYLFHEYEKNSLSSIDKIGWLIFRGNIKETLFMQFPDIQGETPDDYMRKAEAYINKQGRKLLLMIDNANNITPQDTAFLSTLACKIIITSRKKLYRISPVNVGFLSVEDCRVIYREHSGDNFAADEVIDEITKTAGRHTLSVELLAKTQCSSRITAQGLLATLKEKGFDLAEDIEKVTFLYNPEKKDEAQEAEAYFIGHLEKLFDIADIGNDSEKLRVLQLFSLLAPEPVPVEMIRKWFKLHNLSAINKVVDIGWLSSGDIEGIPILYMHPVISAVIRNKAMPSNELVKLLVDALADELDLEPTDVFTSKLPFIPHALLLAGLPTIENAGYALLFNNIAAVYFHQGDYDKALEWYGKALAICEKVLGKEHPDTATTYNNIALVYDSQGDYGKALEWYGKALAICEGVLGRGHPDTAAT
jgi:tetratricopeptide (TPR) repeat protein